MSDIVLHDVSLAGREPRAAIETTISTPYGALHVAAAHLGLSFRERRHQAAVLAKMARSGPLAGIMLGDFNDWLWRGSVERALTLSMPEWTRHRTFPAILPIVALDRIYCRPANLLVRSWTDKEAWRASDHLPIIADLDLSACT
jgi:endonuclease/exonuclease/phosphatase family metal-dependent hydrolase